MIKKIFFVTFILVCTISFGQRIKIDKKKLSFLQEETKVGVKLTFPEDLIFHGEKTEKEFIASMSKRRGRKDASKGQEWKERYEKVKATGWTNDFIKALNPLIAEYNDLRFIAMNDAVDYTLIIEADWIYPGYGGQSNVGREEAKLQATLKFVKTIEPDIVLYQTTTPRIIGYYDYGEFGSIVRIGEAYKKLAYVLNLQLKRVLK